ncbi:MAG: hypothetical protein U0R65_11965 [Candidatus Nanopelagicales bacterium]
MTSTSEGSPRRSRKGTVVAAVVSVAVLAAVFFFLFPKFADYGAAFEQILAMSPWWIAALVAASLVNIVVYPLTEIAAIPGLSYRAAFASRQSAFTISNVIPGGGAVAVATQYAILAGYRVAPAVAAAAVSADGAWTYLITLAAPSIAVGLLLMAGDSTSGFTAAAVVGLAVVVVSVAAIAMVLRSEAGARRLGGWLQRPADRVFALLKRTPPDATAALVQFHLHASEMVGERWRSLTVTNVAAQFAPVLVLGTGPRRPRRVPFAADGGRGLRRVLDRAPADDVPPDARRAGDGRRGARRPPRRLRCRLVDGAGRRPHLAGGLVRAATRRRTRRSRRLPMGPPSRRPAQRR